MNGTLIPEDVANACNFNGINITDVFMNGIQVWHQVLYSGPDNPTTITTADGSEVTKGGVEFLSSVTIVAGTDFPADTVISVSMIGGGGSGGAGDSYSANPGGGYAGDISEGNFTVPSGTVLEFTAGIGGAGAQGGSNRDGNAGLPSSLFRVFEHEGYTLSGPLIPTATGGAGGASGSMNLASGYDGQGASHTNSYGTFSDGLRRGGSYGNYGGQSGFANGGSGGEAGSPGAKGSGGGSADTWSNNDYSGAGGKGMVQLTW